ncbi:hypothetical protein evm_013011 [Chilo suppressalis]|nr:hypothetical protein evm_013011 [Chilo suppressalis]
MEWSNGKYLEFIEDYKKSEVLWDIRNSNNKKRRVRREVILGLAQKYDSDEKGIRRKIKTIRNAFLREHKRIINKQGSGSTKERKIWFAYESLQFLLNVIELRPETKPASTVGSYNLSEESIFKELDELSKMNLSMADRILLVESRNTWGRTVTVTLSPSRADVEIQSIINEWKEWLLICKFRDTPLMYKCYMCKKAWWSLYDFREHLEEEHNSEQFHCYFETMYQECNIIAGLEATPEFDNFPIDSDCLKCGNNYDYHRQNKGDPGTETAHFYICRYCRLRCYTCSSYMKHQSNCVSYREFLRNSRVEADNPEFHHCLVCKLALVSEDNLRKHYSVVHSVRSDVPILTPVKTCIMCHVNFVDLLFHKCLHKIYSTICSGCTQSFRTKVTKDVHEAIHKKKFRCRICNVMLDSDCMETQHIASNHSTNFQIVYKCPACTENVFLLNDKAIQKHALICHKNKFDKRRRCFEMVVVPAKCVTSEMNFVTTLSGKFGIKAKPCSDDEDLPLKIFEDDSSDDASKDYTETFRNSAAFANIVLFVKSDKDHETNRPKDENVPETVAEQSSDDTVVNENIEKPNIKIEKDDVLKEIDEDVNFLVDRVIKQDPEFIQENIDDDYEMLLSKVLGGSNCSTTSMESDDVKQEIVDEIVFEDDTMDRQPYDLFLVILDLSREGKKIFSIKAICHISNIRFEPPRKRGIVGQCHNCQLYGHSARFCFARAWCVKCTLDHGTKDCTRPRVPIPENPPSCVLCGGEHTANYRGCPKAPQRAKTAAPLAQGTISLRPATTLAPSAPKAWRKVAASQPPTPSPAVPYKNSPQGLSKPPAAQPTTPASVTATAHAPTVSGNSMALSSGDSDAAFAIRIATAIGPVELEALGAKFREAKGDIVMFTRIFTEHRALITTIRSS